MVRKIPYEVYENSKEWRSKKAGQYYLYNTIGGLAVFPLVIYMIVHLMWKYPVVYAIGLGILYIVIYCFVIIKYILPNRIVVLPPEKPTDEMIKRKEKSKERAESFQNYLEKMTDESDEEDELNKPLEPY